MKVLVTGAAGYLGRSTAVSLLAAGHEVVPVVRQANDDSLPNSMSCDLAEPAAVQDLFERVRPEAVVHAAAAVGRGDNPGFRQRLLRDNIGATAHLAAAASEFGCARIVYCSTISVYPRRPVASPPTSEDEPTAPRDPYGQSKLIGESAIDLAIGGNDSVAISLRLAGIHGPPRRTGSVASFVRSALLGKPLRIDEPRSIFRFAFIDDAVAAIGAALSASLAPGHHRFNIAGAEAVTLGTLARRIAACADVSADIQEVDKGTARQDAMAIETAQAALGYAPQALDAGLSKLIAYLRECDLDERA